jgi:DNA-binding MarR family transcriptional regulator
MAAAANVHLDPLECWMLGRVADRTIADPAALAERARVEPAELTAALSGLRGAGLITEGPERATLTPAGTEALARLQTAWRDELERLVADWEPGSDPELEPVIDRLAEALATDPEPART